MGMRTIEENLQIDNSYTLTLVIRFLNRLVLLQKIFIDKEGWEQA